MLAHDLDHIVLKALRHEPEDRYPSVAELLHDLQRHAEARPVLARQGSRIYRLQKSLRRNWPALSALAAVVIVLAGFSIAMALQARRAAHERDKAQWAQRFMVELFEVNDPEQARGNDVTAREVMDRAVEKIDRELSAQPEIQATLLNTIGEVYLGLALFPRAATAIRRGLDMRRGLFSGAHPDVADSLEVLGKLLTEQGQYSEAVLALEEAARMREITLGREHLAVARAKALQAHPLVRLSRFTEASTALNEALRLRRRALPAGHPDIARTEGLLAFALRAQGRAADRPRILQLLRSAVPALEETLGPDAGDTLTEKKNLAGILRQMGKLEESETFFRQVLESEQRVFGTRHPRLGFTLNNLGLLLMDLGKDDEAERHLREALALRREVLAAGHPAIGVSSMSLAALYLQQKDPHAAAELFEESLRVLRSGLPPGHLAQGHALLGLGRARIATMELSEAEAAPREALEIRLARLPADDPSVAAVHMELGRCLLGRGHLGDAEPFLRSSFASFDSKGNEEKRRTTARLLARLLEDSQRPEKAAEFAAIADNPAQALEQ